MGNIKRVEMSYFFSWDGRSGRRRKLRTLLAKTWDEAGVSVIQSSLLFLIKLWDYGDGGKLGGSIVFHSGFIFFVSFWWGRSLSVSFEGGDRVGHKTGN
jgi:hypothetical protein